MAHMAPYRLPGPALEPPPTAKKRRKTASGAAAISAPQAPPTMQDLLPPAPTGFGDTVVASNPFDDTPTVQNTNSMMSHHMMRGMGPPPGMNQMQMNMSSPMGPMRSPNMGPMSPMHGMAPMGSPMSVHCGRPLSGGGGPMGSPMNPMVPPMGSPMNIGPQMHSPVLNGPMNNGPTNNGPMGMNNNSMNGPMNMNSGPMGVPNSPMGMTSAQINMSNGPMSNVGPMNMNNVGPMNGPMNISNNSMCINSPMNTLGSMNMNSPMGMMNGPMSMNSSQMGMSGSPLGPRMNGPLSNNSMLVSTSINNNITPTQGSMPSNIGGPTQMNSGPMSSGPMNNQMGMSPMGNNPNQLPHGPNLQRSGPSPINSGNQLGPNQNQMSGSIPPNQMGLRQSPLSTGPPVVSSVANSLGHSTSVVNNQTTTSVAMSQGHIMTSVPNSMSVSTVGSASLCNVSHTGPNAVSSGGINTHANPIGPITNTSTMNAVNSMGPGPMLHGSGAMSGPPQNSMVCGPGSMNHGPNTMGPPMGFMNSNQMGQGPGMGSCQSVMGPGNNPGAGMGGGMGHMGPMGMYVSPMGAKSLSVSAGKVYPADQPMVFNPQNPNAPPIYPCGVCHKEVHDNDQAILCESGCNFWFHRSCTGLTEGAYQLLTAEVYAEWVCDKCLASKHIPLVKFKP